MKKPILIVCAVITLQLIGLSCSKSSVAPAATSFKNDVLPIFATNCAGCHTAAGIAASVAAGAPAGPVLTNYSEIKANITKFNNAVVVNKAMPPVGKTPLTAAQLSIIKSWVDAGANDN